MAYDETAKRVAAVSARMSKPRKEPTDLYFIETECAERHIKIGVASNVRSRMSKMQMDCPYRLRLIKRVPGAAHLEKELHQEFSGDRLGGEWFRRSELLLARIDELEGIDTLETTSYEDFPPNHLYARHRPTSYLRKSA